MAVALELTRRAAHQNVRHIVVQVLVGIAHVGPVEDQRVVEQRAVAIRRLLQLVDEVREALHVVLVDVRIPLDVRWILGMVRAPWKPL